MRFGWSAKDASVRLYRTVIIVAVLMTVFYIYIYGSEPFPEFWNQFFVNFFLQVASLFAAVTATLVWLLYEKADAPRRVWGPFAVGLWLWFAAESTWGYLNMTIGDVPVGLPDVFWVSAYFVFGLALLNQYRILLQPNPRALWKAVSIMAVALLAFTLLIYGVFIFALESPARWDTAVNSFYPSADFLMAGAALWLARHFQGGAFARPWQGLLVFTFADLLYAWLEASGTYAWSIDQGNLLSTVTDVTYLSAYLVLFVGVFHQWLFLKYGLLSSGDEK